MFDRSSHEWMRSSGRSRRGRTEEKIYVTSESVLRQKQACREAVEKCRAGRGAHIQWGRDYGKIQDYNKIPRSLRITTS